MDGTIRVHLAQPVDRVLEVVADLDFLRRRAEAGGEKNVVVGVDPAATGKVIRIERDVERSMPGFMKKVFNPVNHLIDIQRWNTTGAAKISDWTVEIAGQKRIEMRGQLSLIPTGDGGCDHVEAYTVSVAIPLIGGRVEKYVIGEAETSIRAHVAFLQAELASRG